MKRATVGMTLAAVGLGFVFGALYVAAFQVKPTANVCEKDGSCKLHYSAPEFVMLVASAVVGILGVGLVWGGARAWASQKDG